MRENSRARQITAHAVCTVWRVTEAACDKLKALDVSRGRI